MTKKRRRAPSAAETFGRFVRGLLTVVTSTLFGLSAGALGMHGLLTVTIGGIRQDGWGAAPAWLLFMAIGGGIGLIVGLITSIGWIRNRELSAYRVFDWLGLLLGIAVGVGLTLLVPDRDNLFFRCIFGTLIVPPCAVISRALIGGVIGPQLVERSRPVGRQ
jgi:uncharacterized membrane protein